MPTPKQQLLEHFARIGKAVANPARLELLDLLSQSEKTVEQLARQAGLAVTNASNHLKELRLAGLVTSRREGAFVRYRLADDGVHELLRSLQRVAERRLAEARQIVHTYFEAPDALDPIDADELVDRLHAEDVMLLDVRPSDEYESAHIDGAISVPVTELETQLAKLPRDREVVAYCRGPYCVLSLQAVELLRARGIAARRLEASVRDWRARGYAVASGAGPRSRGKRRKG